MKPLDFESCVYCPRLCRHVCPVAVGSGRESTTPTAIMTGVWQWLRGESPPEAALESATLCTQCGACESHCKLSRPVATLLSETISKISTPPEPLDLEIEGEQGWIAVETDSRRWAEALARHLGEPVSRVKSADELGAALLDHPSPLKKHLASLKKTLADRPLMVSSHRALEIATRAGLEVHHLGEHIDAPLHTTPFHPCAGPRLEGEAQPFSLQCCGAHDSLQKHHAKIADEVGESAVRELGGTPHACPDSRCAAHLKNHGAQVSDPIDWLLAAYPEP